MTSRDPHKRITSAMALSAIGLALGILALSLTYVIPFSELLAVVFIPFLAALIVLKGDYRSALLFLAGSVAVSFIDMQEGFFEYLPNVIIGLCFGFAVKKTGLSYPSFLCLIIISLIINLLMIYPVNFFYKVDMIQIYGSLFKMTRAAFTPLFGLFTLLIVFIQSLITYLIIAGELKKVQPNLREDDYDIDFTFCLSIDSITFLAIVLFAFISEGFGANYILNGLFLIEGLVQAVIFFRKKFLPWMIAGSAVSLVASLLILFLAPASYKYLFFAPISFIGSTISIIMLNYSRNRPEEETPETKDLLKEQETANERVL